MDKSKALERLAALESEAAKLREIIEAPAPAPAPSLLTKPKPGSEDDYWIVEGVATEPLGWRQCCAQTHDPESYTQGNIIQSEDLAAAYAEAFDTFLLLRHQPGTVSAGDVCFKYVIHIVDAVARGYYLSVDNVASSWLRTNQISPCFDSKESARAAIAAVGEDRILRMFKTFHHVTD